MNSLESIFGDGIFKLLKNPRIDSEPVFVYLLRSSGIDPQPGEIDSWAP
jgi:hypothetical protein